MCHPSHIELWLRSAILGKQEWGEKGDKGGRTSTSGGYWACVRLAYILSRDTVIWRDTLHLNCCILGKFVGMAKGKQFCFPSLLFRSLHWSNVYSTGLNPLSLPVGVGERVPGHLVLREGGWEVCSQRWEELWVVLRHQEPRQLGGAPEEGLPPRGQEEAAGSTAV